MRLLFVLLFLSGCATSTPPVVNSIRSSEPRLHFMDLQGSGGKSTILERENELWLVEVPVIDLGGDAKVWVDDRAAGQRILDTLAGRFPGKPLRYVLHSHWHQHSLSSLEVFLERGIKLVTTRANFEKIASMLPPGTAEKFTPNLVFVDQEQVSLEDELTIYRVTKKDYPSLPSEDYLFFNYGRFDAFHVGCMMHFSKHGPVFGRELLGRRMEDLSKFFTTKSLRPKYLLRTAKEEDGDERVLFDRLEKLAKEGISASELSDRFRTPDLESLRARRPAMIREAIENNVPASVFNGMVFEALGEQKLELALELAELQVLIAPEDANAWDTLGEVRYFLEQPQTAEHYAKMSRAIAKGRPVGGVEAWRAELEELRAKWSAAAR